MLHTRRVKDVSDNVIADEETSLNAPVWSTPRAVSLSSGTFGFPDISN